jgi:hypothetical protein
VFLSRPHIEVAGGAPSVGLCLLLGCLPLAADCASFNCLRRNNRLLSSAGLLDGSAQEFIIGQGLVDAASPLPRAVHAHSRLLAQSGGTLVCDHHASGDTAGQLLQRQGDDRQNRAVRGRLRQDQGAVQTDCESGFNLGVPQLFRQWKRPTSTSQTIPLEKPLDPGPFQIPNGARSEAPT